MKLTDNTQTRRWLMAVAVLVLSILAGCSVLGAPSVPSPPPLRLSDAGPRAQAVSAQLQSARLYHEAGPRLTGKPVLRALVDGGWSAVGPLEEEVQPMGTRRAGGVRVNLFSVRFTSHQWQGRPVRIFGFYGYPATPGRKPALLLVHGGGGYATVERVLEAARHGYAALSIDLPGKGTQRERFSRSTGPDMTVPQIFTVKPTLQDNYLYNAVLAQMRAVTFLCTRGQVDPERIGMVGVSWGGASGLITTSLDKRIKCFVNMFGSGFLRGGSTWHQYFDKLPAAEFETWERNFDASVYAGDIRVPVLGLTATNDNCYYLPRFLQTQRLIQPTPDLLLRPNLDHKIDDDARVGYFAWLGYHLWGKASSRPRLEGMRVVPTEGGCRLYVRAGEPVALRKAEVWYSAVANEGWTNRKWLRARCWPDASRSWWGGEFRLPSQITYVFANVFFRDGSVLSTPVHSVARITVNGQPVMLDVPYMDSDPLKVEAHYFASLVGAQARPDPATDRVTLILGTRQVDCPAVRVGANLYYVLLRQATEGLGGAVTWEKAGTSITVPSGRR